MPERQREGSGEVRPLNCEAPDFVWKFYVQIYILVLFCRRFWVGAKKYSLRLCRAGCATCRVITSFASVALTVHCDERYVIVKNCGFCLNVYLPCVLALNGCFVMTFWWMCRHWAWRDRFPDCQIMIAREFNVTVRQTLVVAAELLIAFYATTHLNVVMIAFLTKRQRDNVSHVHLLPFKTAHMCCLCLQ